MYQFKIKPKSIQPKLITGKPGDKYEQEADAVADIVMRMGEDESLRMQPIEEEELIQPKIQMQVEEEEEPIQMMCDDCHKEQMVQRQDMAEEELIQPKSNGPQHKDEIDAALQAQINNSKGKGLALDKQTQSFMGNRFGKDFSHVQVHNYEKAHQLNSQINARAFTIGNDIYFNRGNYSPGSNSGKQLLAHELAHVVQQGAALQPMIQKDGETPAPASSGGSSTPLADLLAGLLRDQLSNSSMRGHLSSLGTALQGLAVESTTTEGDQPTSAATRLSALGVSRAFEITSTAILQDPGFARLRQRIVEIVGSSDEAALVAALAAGLAAVLSDVPLRGSPSQDLGAGFSVGGSFDLGSIQSLQFNNLQLYVQYAREHFRTRLTGTVSRDAETDEFSGTGTGEVRIGSDVGHLLGRVTINSAGEVVLFGRYSGGYQFGGSDRLVFTTDLTHSFASGETIIQPGVSGRFNLGNDQSLRLGSQLAISTDSGLTRVTGFIEYRRDHLQLRIEGSMTGLGEGVGIAPGGDMRLQGTLTIPLW